MRRSSVENTGRGAKAHSVGRSTDFLGAWRNAQTTNTTASSPRATSATIHGSVCMFEQRGSRARRVGATRFGLALYRMEPGVHPSEQPPKCGLFVSQYTPRAECTPRVTFASLPPQLSATWLALPSKFLTLRSHPASRRPGVHVPSVGSQSQPRVALRVRRCAKRMCPAAT